MFTVLLYVVIGCLLWVASGLVVGLVQIWLDPKPVTVKK